MVFMSDIPLGREDGYSVKTREIPGSRRRRTFYINPTKMSFSRTFFPFRLDLRVQLSTVPD